MQGATKDEDGINEALFLEKDPFLDLCCEERTADGGGESSGEEENTSPRPEVTGGGRR